MGEEWASYFCKVNGSLASIFINLGLRDDAPDFSKPWLLWVWVDFQSPRKDGLSASEEAPTLFQIEDALNSHILGNCRAIPCGRITTEGRREFYFYGETTDNFDQAVAAAMAGFRGYKFWPGTKSDPHWKQYLEALYPSPENFQSIKNRAVLEVLQKQGDVHTVEREVRHWVYFTSESSRALFRAAVAKGGFRIISEAFLSKEKSFEITLARNQAVDQESIDSTVFELLRLSQQFDGEYDGWETQATTQ